MSTSDFTTLSDHQAAALRAWFSGQSYNPEALAEAFVRIGVPVTNGRPDLGRKDGERSVKRCCCPDRGVVLG